ncbi:gap junction delta-2 protein [Geospiza fortis]|uniref:Gap junction protein n=1 Tax=Geospiza fortis TaxID=48883 RepID=A0A8N5F1L3_GEOFO|nr:gap junction delta-2 protein [Geospiza fortis]
MRRERTRMGAPGTLKTYGGVTIKTKEKNSLVNRVIKLKAAGSAEIQHLVEDKCGQGRDKQSEAKPSDPRDPRAGARGWRGRSPALEQRLGRQRGPVLAGLRSGRSGLSPGRAAAARTDGLLCCRILLTVVVIFRILIVAIVGETVYDDEQTMFVCNTLQPGCNQACYDQAFPISHIRDQDSMKREDSKKIKNTIVNGVLQNTENSTKEAEPDCLEVKEIPNPAIRTTKSKMRRQEGISRFYIIQVVFRNALEIGFLVGQYFLYGFNVPSMYECDRYPCIKEVECYVSRPTEKTVFLVFMFAVSGICVVLNLAELNHLGWRKIKMAVRGVQAKRKSIYEIRNKDLPRMSMPNFGRTQSSDSAYV